MPDFIFSFTSVVFSVSAFDLPVILILPPQEERTLGVAKIKHFKKLFHLTVFKIPCIPRTKSMSVLGTT